MERVMNWRDKGHRVNTTHSSHLSDGDRWQQHGIRPPPIPNRGVFFSCRKSGSYAQNSSYGRMNKLNADKDGQEEEKEQEQHTEGSENELYCKLDECQPFSLEALFTKKIKSVLQDHQVDEDETVISQATLSVLETLRRPLFCTLTRKPIDLNCLIMHHNLATELREDGGVDIFLTNCAPI